MQVRKRRTAPIANSDKPRTFCVAHSRLGAESRWRQGETTGSALFEAVSMETTSCMDATAYEESGTFSEDDVIKVMVPFEPLTGANRPFTFLLWRRLTEEELLDFLHFHRASQPAVQDAVRQYRRRRRQFAVANRTSGNVRHLTSQKREVGDGAHVAIGLASGDMGIVKSPDGLLPGKGHVKMALPRSKTCDPTCPSDSQLPGMLSKE